MKCSDLSAPFIFQGGTPISQLPSKCCLVYLNVPTLEGAAMALT